MSNFKFIFLFLLFFSLYLDEFEAKESSLCNYNEFTCGNSNQCVLRLNHCDGFPDCLDSSDEIGCSPPMIVQSPDRQIIVAEGENVTLSCKAIGTPTPIISWKLNWESIRSNNPRLVTSSNNGYGTLTIKNVQQSDMAMYTCQARNNLDSTSAPYDSELIIKSKNGICLPPYFNDDARIADQCLRCFCFNLTSSCYSSNLKVQTIPLNSRLRFAQLVFDTQRDQYREIPVHPINQEKIIYNQGNAQFILNSSVGDIGESVIYWSLPYPFTGNLIKSYGELVKYVYGYSLPSTRNKLKEVDVIIRNEHNNLVAYHSYEHEPTPNTDLSIQLRLTEHEFVKERFSKSLPFDRPEFLTLLQNVTHFYVRAKFDRHFVESKILGVELDVGVEDLKGNDHLDVRNAKLVEKCSCPLGYSGTSCESCQVGYVRSSAFHFGLGSCVRETSNCMCHGNSNFCDPFSRCYNCQNNSEGHKCERCKRGYYGDPTRGIPCKKCDCPELDVSSSSSESNGACVLDSNGVTATCVSCPLGTTGNRCQDCAPNYYRDSYGKCKLKEAISSRLSSAQQRNPTQGNVSCAENQFKCKESNDCIPISLYCNNFADCPSGSDEENCPNPACHPDGSYDPFYNRRTRKCDCKPFVSGLRCDQCQSNSFNFGGKNGCTPCHCMGVSNRCEDKNLNKKTIILNPDETGLNLTTIDDIQITEDDGSLKMAQFDTENSISFLLYTQNPLQKKPTTILYWKLPKQYLGNKLNAYGGRLSYKIIFEHIKPDEQLSYSPDLVLVGSNKVEIHYSKAEPLKSRTLTKMSIDLVEDSFTDAKGEPIRKDQLMHVLYDLDRILIKASYTKDIVFTGIKEIELNTADRVEKCQCPVGYTGDSCELCSQGYFKKPGNYYHQCIPCDCNRNSNQCDSITGKCLNCENNFEGERCDRCKNGFMLSRTRGFAECIKPSENENQYRSGICNDSVEGNTCNRCKASFYNLLDGQCSKCSCSDVTGKCRETFAYLDEINVQSEKLQLKHKDTNLFYSAQLSGDQKFTFNGIPRDRILHFQLPPEFLGNQIKSYGYNLSYQLDVEPAEDQNNENEDNRQPPLMIPDIEISSRTATLQYTTGDAKGGQVFNIPLKENVWEILDSKGRNFREPSKSEFTKVLSDIQEILIRAVYHDQQKSTSISNIRLITVNDVSKRDGQSKVQTNVEQCICPASHEGSSCERCAPEFAKNPEGLCVVCNCNGHSNECRFVGNSTNSYQECLNCLHNTFGRNCEQCLPTFYGDSTLKTPNACKPCACPSIRPSGNFASSCRQQIDSGEIICNCMEGYSGQNCNTCAAGYEPDNRYAGRCRISTLYYRNRTALNAGISPQIPPLPDSSQMTIVSAANSRLRIDPNHLSQTVRKGETALLRCVAQSTSDKNGQLLPVMWTRESASLPTQNRQTQGILELFNVQPVDSGIYYCLSNDPDGTVLKLRANLMVREDDSSNRDNKTPSSTPPDYYQPQRSHQPLNVRTEPRLVNVRVGESVLIRCLVMSGEPMEINWYKSSPTNELVPERRVVNNALTISSAVYMDSGDYYCEGRNNQGNHKARSRLIVSHGDDQTRNAHNVDNQSLDRNQPTDSLTDVIVPPSVHIIPERQTIVQGKSSVLHCVAEGNPSPKIIWSKARAELDPARHTIINSQNKSTLEIRDAVINDRGLYVCRAENSGGMTQQSSIVEIERREIPAVEIYPSAVQLLPEHSSALFQCRLTAGIPTPTIEWRKADGTDLDDKSNIEVLPGGVIRFSRLTSEQQGKYICTAYNNAGRVSAEALLHVQGSINVRIKQTGPYRVRAGDRARLDCELSGSSNVNVPEYRVEWRKMVSNNSQIQIPYITVDKNRASLIINSVNSDDSGYYICFGLGAQNNQIISQERIQIIVEPPTDSFTEPAILVEDRVVRAQVDQPIEIRCFVRNTRDNIKINWMKRDSNLPANSRVEDGVLYIEKVSYEDDGIYLCIGKNERTKTTEFTQDIKLAVVASPKITLIPALQSVKAGDQVKVRCETQDPTSKVHWTKLNPDYTKQTIKLVGNQDAMFSVRNYQDQRMRQIDDMLVIDNVSPEDQGSYLCTVASSGGITEATAEILVTDSEGRSSPSNADNEVLRSQRVQAGKTVVLKCPMKANYANVEWQLDQHELPENANPNQYILTLNNVRKSNEGRYICIAYDERGSIRDRDYVYLNVQSDNQGCTANEFSCDNTCIVNSLRCNNKYDCIDMTDEEDCESNASTEDGEVELGGSLILDCIALNRSNSQTGKFRWYRMNRNQPTDQFADNIQVDGSKLIINNVRAENAGVYRCSIDGEYKDNVVTIKGNL